MAGTFTKAYFYDEAAAFAELESIVWPNGPTCPKCGATDRIGSLEGVKDKKGRVRHGLRKCYACRSQFTVRIGTIFEDSHLPLHLWLQAAFLMCSSKKGVSANQLHRTLGCTLKTAWFVGHRLREAMMPSAPGKMGGDGGVVEVDETYLGNDPDRPRKPMQRGVGHKNQIVTLVERGGGARSYFVPERATRDQIIAMLFENVKGGTSIMTDESSLYSGVGRYYPRHDTVVHTTGEYVRGDAHTNTVEGFYSIFKRGMRGVYQHCSKKHLHRYLAEFDFRYSYRVKLGYGDEARTETMMRGIIGKRLTYR